MVEQPSRRPAYTTRAGIRKSAVPYIVAVFITGVVVYLVNVWLVGTWLTETGLFIAAVSAIWALGMWRRYRPVREPADRSR